LPREEVKEPAQPKTNETCWFCKMVDPDHKGSMCPMKPSNQRLTSLEAMLARIEKKLGAGDANSDFEQL